MDYHIENYNMNNINVQLKVQCSKKKVLNLGLLVHVIILIPIIIVDKLAHSSH